MISEMAEGGVGASGNREALKHGTFIYTCVAFFPSLRSFGSPKMDANPPVLVAHFMMNEAL